jgi:uncharacterized Zn finger protein
MSRAQIKAIQGTAKFDPEALREIAGEKAYARGVSYFKDGCVELLDVNGKRVLARVKGSEIYRSELRGGGQTISGACSCPAFSDWGFCKHLVAVALTANALKPGAASQSESRFSRVGAYLRKQGIDALIGRIMDLAERDPALFEELEFAASLESTDDKTLSAALRKAITDATRIRGYVEYREASDWAGRVDHVLDRIEALISQGKAGLAPPLLEYFFERMETALNEIDDSDGHAGDLCSRASEIHHEAYRLAKPEPIGLARGLFQREMESGWDFFYRASDTYADVLGETGLAEYHRLAEAMWQTVKPRPGRTRRAAGDDTSWRRDKLARILERFAERDGDLDARIAIRAADLSSAYDYLGIAQLLLAHDRKGEALRWAEDGLWQFENDPDRRLVVFAADLYRQAGRQADAEALLWRLFERAPDLEVYGKLKEAAGPDNAVAARDRAITVLRAEAGSKKRERSWVFRSEILIRILLQEGLLAEAWAEVRAKEYSPALIEDLAKASETAHPSEALWGYAKRVEQMVGAGGSANYEGACRLIARMARIRKRVGESDAHSAWLTAITARHRAKRNFIKLLRTRAEPG